MIGNSYEVMNFDRLFLELNWFICNSPRVLPGHRRGELTAKVDDPNVDTSLTLWNPPADGLEL